MAKQAKQATASVPRLKQKYQAEIIAKLGKEFDIANVSAVPKLEKIVLN